MTTLATDRQPYDPSCITHCRQCGAPLTSDSQWCGAECENAWRWTAHAYTETVQGEIVGGNDRTYEFWPYAADAYAANWTKIAWGCFPSDEDAIAWFQAEYPDWFLKGVEMRVR